MKQFITHILLFIFPIIIALFYIDAKISSFLAKEESIGFCVGENKTWNKIFNGKLNNEIAIYGNSRAWVQVNPKIIKNQLNKSCYNFGIDGQNLNIQLLRSELYLKYNNAPKIIIYVIDFTIFDGELSEYNYHQFLPYMFWNNDIKKYTNSFSTFSFLDYYVPLVRYKNEKELIDKAIELKSSNQLEYRIKGYKGFQKKWDYDLYKNKKPFEINISGEDIHKFETFLASCSSKNIDVILVSPPIHIEGQAFLKNQKEIITIFEDIASKYKLSFLDYNNDEICTDRKYFYNAGHLNLLGSEKFTKKLIKDISTINKID